MITPFDLSYTIGFCAISWSINASEEPIIIDHAFAQKPIVYDKSKGIITYLDEKNEKSFSFWKTASEYLANKSSSIDRMYAAQ